MPENLLNCRFPRHHDNVWCADHHVGERHLRQSHDCADLETHEVGREQPSGVAA